MTKSFFAAWKASIGAKMISTKVAAGSYLISAKTTAVSYINPFFWASFKMFLKMGLIFAVDTVFGPDGTTSTKGAIKKD